MDSTATRAPVLTQKDRGPAKSFCAPGLSTAVGPSEHRTAYTQTDDIGLYAKAHGPVTPTRHAHRMLGIIVMNSVVDAIGRAGGVDDLIFKRMDKREITGLSLAVVHEGTIVKAKMLALANT